METIKLSERPHFVIQGEGNLVGKKMLLFRVAGCHLGCNSCDSAFTWNTVDSMEMVLDEFLSLIYDNEEKFDYVMITGGAPSLYKEFLYKVFEEAFSLKFQVEDAGDTDWSDFKIFDNVCFSFSPKIAALQSTTNIVDWKAFEELPVKSICKIVVDKNHWENNLNQVREFQKKYSIADSKVYLMPKGVEREEIIEQSQFLVDKCFKYNYNFSTRLHILLYGNKRGV